MALTRFANFMSKLLGDAISWVVDFKVQTISFSYSVFLLFQGNPNVHFLKLRECDKTKFVPINSGPIVTPLMIDLHCSWIHDTFSLTMTQPRIKV
jgi:hypothetical protein